MSWDKLEIEAWHENWNKRNEIISEKKGNDTMNLQNYSKEGLIALQGRIANEIQKREEVEIEKVTEEFYQLWKKMSKMGIKLRTEEISSYTGNTGKLVKDLQIEINGNLVDIYQ